jgi:hypothetical protein
MWNCASWVPWPSNRCFTFRIHWVALLDAEVKKSASGPSAKTSSPRLPFVWTMLATRSRAGRPRGFSQDLRGLASKIYIAFLITAAVPVLMAGQLPTVAWGKAKY